ncbi:SRPBCC domain-containing protein [Ottowia caeni]|uniref:SRPBCC domain-containing protein n=1 Tax=Ottowia caeni TaxID=2870339 RepID=UPI001E34124E|nr:hypothetical protein [Ottowia caeni]
MDFRIDAILPATAAELWAIFFDVERVAALIPGCEQVTEVEPLRRFSAVMKQKIGPFKLEVPTRIEIESHIPQQQVVLVASGIDKFTSTTIDVRMKVDLAEQRADSGTACQLHIDASMQVAGRLASLGYPIVKKRSEEIFAEFERRLRAQLSGVGLVEVQQPEAPVAAPEIRLPVTPALEPVQQAAPQQTAVDPLRPPTPSPVAGTHPRHQRIELVLLWPRVGISVGVSIAVAHGAVAFGQSPWWWLVAPLLGIAAGLGQRGD